METTQAYTLICRNHSLPQPSTFSLEFASRCAGRHDSLEECIRLLSGNLKFTADLLRYAASPMLGEVVRDRSLAAILANLGPETVANLAIFFSLLGQYRYGRCPHFDYQRFWQKSLVRGAAAQALAGRHKSNGQLFFTYGLLSGIGELALATAFPEEYGDLLTQNFHHEKMEQQEKQAFGLSAAELGHCLLTDWYLPMPFIKGLKGPSAQTSSSIYCRTASTIHKILTLANHIAKICLFELPLTGTFLAVEQQAEQLAIPVEQFGPFFDRIVASWQTTSEFFEVPTLRCPNYHQIKTLDDPNLASEQDKPSTLTILAADDDPITLLFLEKVLSAEHRNLLLAKDGKQALEMALEHRPHLFITDWMMPVRSGIDLCKILRKTSVTQHMYIIMLTSNESEDELVQAFDAGADDYIIKPFTAKVLQARIASGERLIRSQQTISHDREVIHRYAVKLASTNRKLQNMAMTDFLTGLPNRRNALQRLKDLVAEVQRYGEPLSCLMIDIDHFKRINDNYGHDIGDTVLRHITKLLEEKARSYDMVSRWGGEEFLVISARSGTIDSYQLAERLRKTVENFEIHIADNLKIKITISVGVASWYPQLGNAGELIKIADRALYQAKSAGRNRVELAPFPKQNPLP